VIPAARMGRIGRLGAVLLLLLGGASALPRGAAAHALLQSSDPAVGSTVAVAPSVVTLTFGEAPDPTLSSVTILDASGRNVASGPAAGVTGHPEQLQVPLGSLPDGVYTVAWRTVSTVDGHTVAGSFGFGVGVSPAVAGAVATETAPTSASASPTATIVRFLLYAGLILLFGAGLIGAAVHPRPPPAVVTLAVAGWMLSMIGAAGVVIVQALDTGATLGAFLDSGVGRGAISRLVMGAVGGVAAGWLVAQRRSPGRAPFVLAAALAAAGMLVDVVNGHAAASGPTLFQIVVQWLHVVAVAVWLGGLAALLASLRGSPDPDKTQAAWRFSRIAGVALATVAATGLVRAAQEVGTIDGLLGTDFGRVVIIKSLLLLVLVALGAVNHFIGVRRAARSLGTLRRVGRVEVAIGVVVLLATGILVNLVPPSSVAATPGPPPAPPLTLTGSDFGTTVHVQLVVTPGTAGINEFAATVTDYDTGDPVPATSVSLRFLPASSSGIGGSTLRLTADEPGRFGASGGNLSLDGIWQLTAVVAAPTATVEVPLATATRVPDMRIDANPVPGAPTILTAHLPGGPTLQVYLDPGTAGSNELHATFFDAAGNELPVTSATYLVGPADGPADIIVPRQLEPGHFVADLTAVEGQLSADIVGPAPDGSTIHAHFDIPVQP
jgi:copper transport protein